MSEPTSIPEPARVAAPLSGDGLGAGCLQGPVRQAAAFWCRATAALSEMTEGSVPDAEEIAACILALVAKRGAGKTICPSEVARALRADWRPLMPAVRAVAGDLAARDRLAVTQSGRAVDPASARGPIRLAMPEPPRS